MNKEANLQVEEHRTTELCLTETLYVVPLTKTCREEAEGPRQGVFAELPHNMTKN